MLPLIKGVAAGARKTRLSKWRGFSVPDFLSAVICGSDRVGISQISDQPLIAIQSQESVNSISTRPFGVARGGAFPTKMMPPISPTTETQSPPSQSDVRNVNRPSERRVDFAGSLKF